MTISPQFDLTYGQVKSFPRPLGTCHEYVYSNVMFFLKNYKIAITT